MSDLGQYAPALLSALAAGVTAFVGTWLAPQRYRSQRWFDRKADVYSLIFDAIGDISEVFDNLSDKQLWENYVVLPEYKEAFVRSCNESGLKLKGISRKSSFIISSDSKRILASLISELFGTVEEFRDSDHLERVGNALRKARDSLVDAARADLKIHD